MLWINLSRISPVFEYDLPEHHQWQSMISQNNTTCRCWTFKNYHHFQNMAFLYSLLPVVAHDLRLIHGAQPPLYYQHWSILTDVEEDSSIIRYEIRFSSISPDVEYDPPTYHQLWNSILHYVYRCKARLLRLPSSSDTVPLIHHRLLKTILHITGNRIHKFPEVCGAVRMGCGTTWWNEDFRTLLKEENFWKKLNLPENNDELRTECRTHKVLNRKKKTR